MADKEDAVEPETASRPSELDQAGLLKLIQAWFKDDAAHSSEWRAGARDDFGFVAGEQWTAEERAALEAQMRPVITFNRALSIIKAVAGTEINGRHEIQFLPRGNEDTAVNEVLTGASKWMADNADAEDEESEAFQHALICGMGWTECRLDYDQNPAGGYVEECISPLEMYWDGKARKKNLTDARRLWRVRKIALREARDLFPGHDDDALDASWVTDDGAGSRQKTEEEKRRREENSFVNDDRDEVTIVQCQWWEREPYWLVADPQSNEKVEVGDDEYKVLAERAKLLEMPLWSVRLYRRSYRQAFLGGEVLECGPAPCREHFSFQCITGEPNHVKGSWFGLVSLMRDPQKWANKWLSQTLHILNSSAKGGIVAEADVFENQRQAEESWARQDRITWARPGKLKDNKVQPKPVAQFPAGHFQLMEFAISSIRDVTGINLELLGMRDANQPGVLEAHRKQSAMTVLATMFDSLRRFRKQVGRIRLYLIQNFLSDGRLVRIAGADGAKVIPLLRDRTAGEYDVIVDDAPASPNQKEQNWLVIAQMLPAFKEQLMQRPELIATILEYSPLPSALVEKLKAVAAAPNPDAEKAQQIAEAAAVAKINRDQAAAEKDRAQAGTTQATAMYDIALAANLLGKNNMGIDSLREQIEMTHKSALIDTERAKADQIRADTAGKHVEKARNLIEPLPDHDRSRSRYSRV